MTEGALITDQSQTYSRGDTRFGSGVLLVPMDAPWEIIQEALDEFEPGFQITREQPEMQAS